MPKSKKSKGFIQENVIYHNNAHCNVAFVYRKQLFVT